MKHRRTKKVLLILLIALCGLLILLFLLFNLPAGHRFITARVNGILKNSGVPIHITSIDRILPKSLAVSGIKLSDQDSDTIIFIGKIEADFSPAGLLKKKILISSVYLIDVSVDIHTGKERLNISEAFSSGKTDTVTETDTTKKKWEFYIGKAEISGASVRMHDSLSGIKIDQKIGNLKVEVNEMSIPDHILLIRSVDLNFAAGNIKISSKQEKQDTTAGVPWNISLEKLALANINLGFNNITGKQMIALKLEKAEVNLRELDLNNKIIDLQNLSVLNSGLILLTPPKQTETGRKPNREKTTRKVTFPWDIEARAINLENITFKTGNYGDSVMTFGINNLHLNLSDLRLNNEESSIEIDETKFDLDNGFSLRTMHGSYESGRGKTTFNLAFSTANSTFNIESSADRDLFGILSDPRYIKNAEVSISDTELSVKDLLLFKSDLAEKPVFGTLADKKFRIDTRATLRDSVITLETLGIESGKSFKAVLNCKINNLFRKEKANGELKINIPDLDVTWLTPVLNAAGVKFEIPDVKTISLDGTFTGSMKSAEFSAGLSGDPGNIALNGTFDYDNDNFYMNAVLLDMLPGKIINNPVFGALDGSFEVRGNGLLHKNLTADIVAKIDSLGFKGYKYTNTLLDCRIQKQDYTVNLTINDPELKCNIESSMNTHDSVISIKTSGNFHAQLNKLNLVKDTLAINGNINAGLRKDQNSVTSDLSLTDVKFVIPGNNSTFTETKVSFKSDSVKTMLNAEGDFFDIKIDVEEPFTRLNRILPGYKRYAFTFIDSSSQDRLKRVSFLPEMKASVKMVQSKTLSLIFRDTAFHFSGFEFKAVNSISDNKINYSLNGSDLKFKGIKVGSLTILLKDSVGRMNLYASAEKCSFLSNQLDKIVINNNFFNQQGLTDISVLEKPGRLLYDFEISTVLDSMGILFSVPSKMLTMNGVRWELDNPGLFVYNRSAKKILPSLRMKTGESYIDISSTYSGGYYTKGEMRQVDVASLLPVDLISGKPTGTITGNAEYSQKSNLGKEINADIVFSNLSWSEIGFRSFELNSTYKSETPKDFIINLNAVMDSSSISLKASKPVEGDKKLNAEFKNLDLRDFQPFVKKILSDLRGSISGNMEILLSDKIENFKGELDITGANVRINTLNSVFKIPSDKVVFTGKKVVFESFRVLDSLDHELFVDGSLDFDKSGTLSDLQILSKNLQVMSSTEKENPIFYGNIYVDSRLSVKGPVTSPDLSGNLALVGGTEIFFKEKENLNLTETEKVMIFVTPVTQINRNAAVKKSLTTRASIDADVKIDPDTKINFQLSKRLFGIDLMIQGGGELSYNMLANGDVNLAGRYEITDGTADVKITGWPNKSFTITRGGSIRWDGKLNDPDLNFEAVNKVHSSYLNPVDNKQRDADFNVTLKIANRLSALDLLFTINTPDQYLMSIINTLSPEEQMRQAITILLFAKIDLPGISTSSDYMTEQVNQLVASQLNQLTKTTISGIDISFGIDSYVQATESGGQETKTSLSYEVKKDLLNNRAQIEVSGRLNDANNSPGASDLSLNNVSFEYRLDAAGTKFLKVYNEHSYEDVFEGEVVKTGVGLTYRKNYPTLKDIWRKKDKKQENQPK